MESDIDSEQFRDDRLQHSTPYLISGVRMEVVGQRIYRKCPNLYHIHLVSLPKKMNHFLPSRSWAQGVTLEALIPFSRKSKLFDQMLLKELFCYAVFLYGRTPSPALLKLQCVQLCLSGHPMNMWMLIQQAWWGFEFLHVSHLLGDANCPFWLVKGRESRSYSQVSPAPSHA